MTESIKGQIVEVGNFNWGCGAILKTAAGHKLRVAANRELTISLAEQLYCRVEVLGRQNLTGGFEAERIIEKVA